MTKAARLIAIALMVRNFVLIIENPLGIENPLVWEMGPWTMTDCIAAMPDNLARTWEPSSFAFQSDEWLKLAGLKVKQ